MGRKTAREAAPLGRQGGDTSREHATDWYHAGNFCERMLGYTVVLSKIELLPKNSRLKTLFRLDSVHRMLMFKNHRRIGRTAQTLDNDTTNGLRVIY